MGFPYKGGDESFQDYSFRSHSMFLSHSWACFSNAVKELCNHWTMQGSDHTGVFFYCCDIRVSLLSLAGQICHMFFLPALHRLLSNKSIQSLKIPGKIKEINHTEQIEDWKLSKMFPEHSIKFLIFQWCFYLSLISHGRSALAILSKLTLWPCKLSSETNLTDKWVMRAERTTLRLRARATTYTHRCVCLG